MLSPSFSSNNPFRRAASPSPSIPSYYNTSTAGTPPAVQQPERPMSTNPFLDDSEVARLQQQPARPVQVPEDIFVSGPVFVVAQSKQPPCCTSPVAMQAWGIDPGKFSPLLPPPRSGCHTATPDRRASAQWSAFRSLRKCLLTSPRLRTNFRSSINHHQTGKAEHVSYEWSHD